MSQDAAENRDLVALVFRLLDAAFTQGDREAATAAVGEVFGRRIRACLRNLPPPDAVAELPEARRHEIRERRRQAALLRRKREAVMRVIPEYARLMERYRSYDAEMGSPQRLARTLKTSAAAVLVGAALGYLAERGLGLAYGSAVGTGLGVLAFFRAVLQSLRASRHMVEVEAAHAAAIERLREELAAAFDSVDRLGPGEEDAERDI